MNTKGVEDGMSDEQAVRQTYPDAYESTIRGGIWSDRYSWGEVFLGNSWANARINIAAPKATKPTTIRSATPEELTAQRESYGKNYKPGPRQATPFMPKDAEAQGICEEMIANLRHNVAAERERTENNRLRSISVEERTRWVKQRRLATCDCWKYSQQVCDICQGVGGADKTAPVPEERTTEMGSDKIEAPSPETRQGFDGTKV